MYQLQGYAGNRFRRAEKNRGKLLGIHQYANAAGMSCAMVVYMGAVKPDPARMPAPGARMRSPDASRRSQILFSLPRPVAARALDTTTIISNKEAEA
jgi:hypothetical protein